MTVSNISPVATGGGNGSTTEWPFSFRLDRAEDIDVILTDSAGENRLLSPAEYDVIGVFPGTGSVIYPRSGSTLPPLGVGSSLTRRRTSDLTQAVDLLAGGEFSAPVVEAMTDRVVMALQELVDEVARAVRLPVQVDPSTGDGDPGTPVVLPTPPETPQFLTYSLADGLTLSGTPDLPVSTQMHGGEYLRVAASEQGYEFVTAVMVLDQLLSTLVGGGLLAHDGAGNAIQRMIVGTPNEIFVGHGAGITGNPQVSLPPIIDLTAKQVDVATLAPGDNSPAPASTAFVQAAVLALINGAPGILDTLQELADAINNDPTLFGTITDALATKLNVADNLADLANVATARSNLGFTDPVFDKAAPGDIGATTPGQGEFTNLSLTGDMILSGGTVAGRDIAADGAVLDALLNMGSGGAISAPGNSDNVALNAFRAVNQISDAGGASRLGLVAGLVDNFADQDAIASGQNAQHGVLPQTYSPAPTGYGPDLTGSGAPHASAGPAAAVNAFDDDPMTVADFGVDQVGTIGYDFGPGVEPAVARVSFIFADGNPASTGETIRIWSSDDGFIWTPRVVEFGVAQQNGVDLHIIDIAGAPRARFWRWEQASVYPGTSGGAREISLMAATGGQPLRLISQAAPAGPVGEQVPNHVRAVLFCQPVDTTPVEDDIALWARRDGGSTVTTDFALGNKWTLAGHGFGDGDRVSLTSLVSLPTGASAAQLYHVVGAGLNDFELSTSAGGPAISLTNDGIGVHTIYHWLPAALEDRGPYDPGRHVLAGDVDFGGTALGTELAWAIETTNSKRVNIHGAALLVRDPDVGTAGSLSPVGDRDHADNIALGAFRTAYLGDMGRLGLAGGFADAFNQAGGLAGRTGGVFDEAGNFFQSSGAPTSEDGGHVVDAQTGLAGRTTFDRSWSLDNGATVTAIAVFSAVATLVTAKIFRDGVLGEIDVLVSETYAHQGGGWQTHVLSKPFAVPVTGPYRTGVYAPVDISHAAGVNHAEIAGDVVGTDLGGFTGGVGNAHISRVWYRGAAEPMTLVTAPAQVEAVQEKIRAVLFQQDIDPVVLNADLKIWATRDDGRAMVTDFAAGNRWSALAHGMFDGDRVTVSSDDVLPGGAEPGRLYYVVNSDTSSLELSLTLNGVAIGLSDNGTGAHRLHKWAQGELAQIAVFDEGWRGLAATVDLSRARLGTTMALCIEIVTPTLMDIHGAALLPLGGAGFDIADLPALGAAPQPDDILPLLDVSTGLTRAISFADLPGGGGGGAGATAGAGLVETGGVFDIGAHVDGSIAVSADAIQVGIINDLQHGARGGGTRHAAATNTSAGFMAAADKLKLSAIAAGATADQTGAEIKALYEGEANTNAFDDAAATKLAGIVPGAAPDQTGAEIKALYEGEANTNAFDDAAATKLAGVAPGAQAGTVTQVTTAGLAQGGPITGAGTVTVPISDQASAQAGTDDTVAMTPLKTGQAIDARLLAVSTMTGVSQTLVPSQNNAVVSLDDSAAITLTLPADLPVGFNLVVRQGLAGPVIFSPAAGASLVNVDGHTRTGGQWSQASIMVLRNTGGLAAQYTIVGQTAP